MSEGVILKALSGFYYGDSPAESVHPLPRPGAYPQGWEARPLIDAGPPGRSVPSPATPGWVNPAF